MIDPAQVYNDMGPELRSHVAHASTPGVKHVFATIRSEALSELQNMTIPENLTQETAVTFVLRYKALRDQVRMATEWLQLLERAINDYAQLGQGER